MVEAVPNGWCYTAGLPGGQRVATCLTDIDIARWLRLREPAAWLDFLNSTTQLKELLRQTTPCGSLLVRATESRYVTPVTGTGWLAVGDAASIFDPLSSQGIVKSLRSGIFASYALTDWLHNGNDTGLQRYGHYIRQEFDSYADIRAGYYTAEQRWPHSMFWQRRHAATTFPGHRYRLGAH